MEALPQASDPVIALVDIAVRVRDRRLLEGTSWRIAKGEQWAVVGPNGAGKSTLVRALAGDLPIVRGRVIRGPQGCDLRIGYVSFELHRELIAREEGRDDARHFSGDWGSQTTVRELLDDPAATAGMPETAARSLEIVSLLDRPIRTLSTGEMRKALIARALARSPGLLILDEPFDGLDATSRKRFTALIGRLMAAGTQVVLVTHRRSEIPPEVTHILEVSSGRVVRQNVREHFFARDAEGREQHGEPCAATLPASLPEVRTGLPAFQAPPVLIEMRGVNVRYGPSVIIEDLDWTVRRGENWTLLGPNGAGKTTLLRMISGDHPQAYANEITAVRKAAGKRGEHLGDQGAHRDDLLGVSDRLSKAHHRHWKWSSRDFTIPWACTGDLRRSRRKPPGTGCDAWASRTGPTVPFPSSPRESSG